MTIPLTLTRLASVYSLKFAYNYFLFKIVFFLSQRLSHESQLISCNFHFTSTANYLNLTPPLQASTPKRANYFQQNHFQPLPTKLNIPTSYHFEGHVIENQIINCLKYKLFCKIATQKTQETSLFSRTKPKIFREVTHQLLSTNKKQSYQHTLKGY